APHRVRGPPRRAGGARAGTAPEDGTEAVRPRSSPEWLPSATGDPTDVNLLIRLRNALEALA
ncbi:hypothetical protein, partial [Planomonospora algeriensis]